jgi:hypothetical protein
MSFRRPLKEFIDSGQTANHSNTPRCLFALLTTIPLTALAFLLLKDIARPMMISVPRIASQELTLILLRLYCSLLISTPSTMELIAEVSVP